MMSTTIMIFREHACEDYTKSPVKLIQEIPLSASCSNGVQSIQGLGKMREDWTAAY